MVDVSDHNSFLDQVQSTPRDLLLEFKDTSGVSLWAQVRIYDINKHQ